MDENQFPLPRVSSSPHKPAMSQTVHRGVYDKDGVGLVLVALVAPGAMWREKSRLLDGIVQEPGPSYILFKGSFKASSKGFL